MKKPEKGTKNALNAIPCPYATEKDDEGLIPPCTYSSFAGEKCARCPDNL